MLKGNIGQVQILGHPYSIVSMVVLTNECILKCIEKLDTNTDIAHAGEYYKGM